MQAKRQYFIAPSILSADLARLGEEVDQVAAAGADWIHFDVMDNHYVPNLTFGPSVCKSLRRYGVTLPIDVHLMVEPVDDLIVQFAEAGATYISFHPEATRHLDRSVDLVKSLGCKVGLALNPATPLTQVEVVLHKLDLLLLMSVNPGFSGQAFIPYVLPKVRLAREALDRIQSPARLEVDGGIHLDNIRALADAGADTFVMGSAIFGSPNYQQIFEKLQQALI